MIDEPRWDDYKMGIDGGAALLDWRVGLVELKETIAPAFGRSELRVTGGAFIDGLLLGAQRKTGWMLAEQTGLSKPYRMQSLLGRSRWCGDKLRDLVLGSAREALGDPDGVLS